MAINYWAKFEEGFVYHIYNRTNNKEKLFNDKRNYLHFIKKWQEYLGSYFDIYAFSLMPNHFHFLVKVREKSVERDEAIRNEKSKAAENYILGRTDFNEFLEAQFRRFFSSYALAFNKRNNRSGSLFQKKFKRILVSDEAKFTNLICYIHHNAIHHELCKKYGEWEFDSFPIMISNKPTLLDRDAVLTWFSRGKTSNDVMRQRFLEYHKIFKEEYIRSKG